MVSAPAAPACPPEYIVVTHISEEEKRKIAEEAQKMAMARVQPQLEVLYKKIAEHDIKLAESDFRLKELKEKKTAADAKLAESIRLMLTEQFYLIFPNQPPFPKDRQEFIYSNYLADGSISTEASAAGGVCFKIRLMTVIRYLSNNLHLQKCDFRPFKAEIYDIPAFAEFLKTSRVTAVAFQNSISADAKAKLAEAVAARKGTLTVRYFP